MAITWKEAFDHYPNGGYEPHRPLGPMTELEKRAKEGDRQAEDALDDETRLGLAYCRALTRKWDEGFWGPPPEDWDERPDCPRSLLDYWMAARGWRHFKSEKHEIRCRWLRMKLGPERAEEFFAHFYTVRQTKTIEESVKELRQELGEEPPGGRRRTLAVLDSMIERMQHFGLGFEAGLAAAGEGTE